MRLLTDLWPRIREQVPSARLRIVGRRARSAFRDHLDRPGVEIHENVPDIIPYFHGMDALLYAPPHGSGMKVKVLEAFALGTPVVTNASGIEGTDAADGVHCGVAEDDAGLVERAVALLRDPARRDAHRIAARRLVEACCGPEATLDAVERMYEAVLAGAGRRRG